MKGWTSSSTMISNTDRGGTETKKICACAEDTNIRLRMRLLMISPFEKEGRATADTAGTCNELVVALADTVIVAYAATGSKTEALCRKVLTWGKTLLTFNREGNSSLIALGL